MKWTRAVTVAMRSLASYNVLLGWGVLTVAACTADRTDRADRWDGTVDTLPNGTIEVHNPSHGIWDSSTAWRVEEETRIGMLEGSGPALFGRISALEVDGSGRIYVFESQAQELRVFDSSGSHVRTIGREGGGPGEFKQGIGLAWSPGANLWVVDPGNVRISVFDTAGTYQTMHRILGGYIMMPWKGRFDNAGRFYHYGLDLAAEAGGRFVMVRFDSLLHSLDTLRIPRPPEEHYFELQTEDGFMRAGVPFSAEISWTLSPSGHLWFANTSDYRIYRRSVAGDTVMEISREFEPLPVTAAEIDTAIISLDWFTRQGGKVDRSQFPGVKPALSTLYVDDEDRLWAVPVVADTDMRRLLDVFDSLGRYLGRVRLPFRLAAEPLPLFRGDFLYGVTSDEFEVPYVVRGRILRP